jgi:hypothetical protein
MRETRWRPVRPLAATPRVALVAVVCALGSGLVVACSAGSGAAVPTALYGGGELMAADPDGGYWTASPTGTVTPHDGAPGLGSPALSGLTLAQSVVGMAPTPDGGGYWLVASDGGIFSFGDAAFHGSTGALHLNRPIVGMAPTPDGGGYWLVASDGGVFTFGDAGYYGSTAESGGSALGIVISPSVSGYTLVGSDGTATTFGPPGVAATALPPTSAPPPPAPATSTTTSTSSTTTTTTASSPATPTQPTNGIQQGVYVGAADPTGVRTFATATATSPTIASDYLPSGSGWTGMDGAGGSLNWLLGAWEGTGYTLSLGVPMIPTDSGGTALGTLAQGATGAYNSYFVTLAQALVAGGASNAYLRLGWEFDGSWFSWSAATSAAEASYASYFGQIVTAMRSVPGAAFRFVWNPDAGAFTEAGYSVEAAYPGDAYVDVIGLDSYDQTWATPQTPANAWSSTTLPALVAAQEFAASVGKPLALPEWGVIIRSDGHGLGDDPYYVNHIVSWMETASNGVAFESYFDYDDGGANSLITGGSFPASLAAFTADLG